MPVAVAGVKDLGEVVLSLPYIEKDAKVRSHMLRKHTSRGPLTSLFAARIAIFLAGVFWRDIPCHHIQNGGNSVLVGSRAPRVQKRGGSLKTDLPFVALHGILHLCGHDHYTRKERDRMQVPVRKKSRVLKKKRYDENVQTFFPLFVLAVASVGVPAPQMPRAFAPFIRGSRTEQRITFFLVGYFVLGEIGRGVACSARRKAGFGRDP